MTDFTTTRSLFDLPDGITYLDGNSLGPLPRAAAARVAQTMTEEWGGLLVTAWNKAGWMAKPDLLGDRIAGLIGATPGSVVLGDTLSIKVYQALAAALWLVPERRVVLSDTGNFPTDLYMAEGLLDTLGQGHTLRLVAPEDVASALTDEVAVLLLTEVDYGTGRKHDMAALSRAARAKGIVTIWDLAHSAGAFPVNLAECRADFAVGCTYKYLNGGPGAPAFIYVAPEHAEGVRPALAGWLGHADPFGFEPHYRPGTGIRRMRVGTPPVLQMAALEAALDIWNQIDLNDLRARSIALSEAFRAGVEAQCPDLVLASPADPTQRGSQISYRHAEGYAIMQALIAAGVIGDFRAPDILRFGFAPLYNSMSDVTRAVAALAQILDQRTWDDAQFQARSAVT